MKVTLVVDNQTYVDKYYYGEPGISYYIETEDHKILFDVGYSSVFMDNASKMGIDLLKVDYLALSHGHDDHTGGLSEFIKRQTEQQRNNGKMDAPVLVAHPLTFFYKESEKGEENGSVIQLDTLEKHFAMHLTKEPYWFTSRFVYLGEIERSNDFENQKPYGRRLYNGKMQQDFMMDDSALVYKGKDGLIILTGCAHAGICNTVEYAKKITKEQKVDRLIGGFHLQNPDKELLDKTLDYLIQQEIKEVYAGHCTDFKSKIALSSGLNIQELGVGWEKVFF